MPVPTHLLYESAAGYAIFDVIQAEEIGLNLPEVQKSLSDISQFGRIVKLRAYHPFTSAADALQNIKDISGGVVNDSLVNFLELNLPRRKKSGTKVLLGIGDKSVAQGIKSKLKGVECDTSQITATLLRGVRQHASKLLDQLQTGELEQAQLGLGHAYSRDQVAFNPNRSDSHIIQAIALLDTTDKAINTFMMRVREWYSWHFPELIKIVNDNKKYAKLVRFIRDKSTLTNESLHDIAAIVDDDEAVAKAIIDAAKMSMGQDLSEYDMENICKFADIVIEKLEYRAQLSAYLKDKMSKVAPNLATLVGEVIAARLISQAGSLSNLTKYPSSTVQILGAEKALFRALKTKGNTPKYGLIYNASAVARAQPKNKGRISRFLANKCSIASRIDAYTGEIPGTAFGQALKDQLEERLEFYETGKIPRKNVDVMQSVMDDMGDQK